MTVVISPRKEMADSTAMTIDFLRARLLSERSVSRAAKERADQLAKRVVELEEQLRTVTVQRKKAEKAAVEVLAILESQGFGSLSDAIDSSSDQDDDPGAVKSGGGDVLIGRKAGRGEVEDALSGSDLGGSSSSQAGKLSWKGRSVSPDSHKKQKAKHLRQKHRRNYYMSRANTSPKYQLGQSCRKIKKKELRSAAEDEGEKLIDTESPTGGPRSDCTDDQPDLDGEANKDERGSPGDRNIDDCVHRYAGKYERGGEMERVLERQAELIGKYEAEEHAQREWEKQFNQNRDSTVGNLELESKTYLTENGCEQKGGGTELQNQVVDCDEVAKPGNENLPSISDPTAACLQNGSISESPQSAAVATKQPELDDEPSCDFPCNTGTISLQARNNVLLDRSYGEIVEGSAQDRMESTASAQGSSENTPIARHKRGRVDESSDSGSNCNASARTVEHYINNSPSVESPLSDTPNSKISKWRLSHFQNHAENQLAMQVYHPTSDNVGGVLEALQRAKMSLREKLSISSPPSQETLALPAPGDYRIRVDLPIDDAKILPGENLSRCPPRQDILALPAPEHFHSIVDLPIEDSKIPVGLAGLFRLPTDSFPKNQICAGEIYDLTASSWCNGFSSNTRSTIPATLSVLGAAAVFSGKQCYDPQSSMLPMTASRRYEIPSSDFTTGGASFLAGHPKPTNDLRGGIPPGDRDMFLQLGGDYTISSKWLP